MAHRHKATPPCEYQLAPKVLPFLTILICINNDEIVIVYNTCIINYCESVCLRGSAVFFYARRNIYILGL